MAIFFLFAEIGPTICCRLPDEASFLEIGGCITPQYPPGSFGPASIFRSCLSIYHITIKDVKRLVLDCPINVNDNDSI